MTREEVQIAMHLANTTFSELLIAGLRHPELRAKVENFVVALQMAVAAVQLAPNAEVIPFVAKKSEASPAK